MRLQEMMGFWDTVASAGPYAKSCTSLQTDNHTNTSLLNFYRPDALPDAKPIESKHGRQIYWIYDIGHTVFENKRYINRY